MDIEEARREIAAVDREIAALFERRLEAAASVADWKKERGLPVRDPEQEERVLARNTALVGDPEKRGLYRIFQQEVMRVTRLWEHRLLGEHGAWEKGPGNAFIPGKNSSGSQAEPAGRRCERSGRK